MILKFFNQNPKTVPMKSKSIFGILLLMCVAAFATPKTVQEMPTFKMSYEIQLGSKTLLGLESVTINSSVDTLADAAIIKLPSSIQNKAFDVEKQIKRGDAVTIKLGYDGNLKTEFEGYIRTISPNVPLTIECEDSIFLTRRAVNDKVFLKTDCGAITKYVASQLNASVGANEKTFSVRIHPGISDLKFDKFVIRNATGFEVLQKLKDDYHVRIYAKGNELNIALPYVDYTKETDGSVVYDFSRNVRDSDLKYVKAEDVKVLVKIKGVGKDNKVTEEVTAGEKGGEVVTLANKHGVTDKTSLQLIAKGKLGLLSFTGYRGNITTFGVPFVDVAYKAKVVDDTYPEREGTYYVRGVNTEFSKDGFKRKVELGVKLG